MALWDLTYDSAAGRAAVARAGAIPWLSELLRLGGGGAREAAAACLRELAAGAGAAGAAARREMRTAGADERLRRLARSGGLG